MPTIKELRLTQQIRPERLALELGVSMATIYNWESGRSEPSLSQARKLAHIFGVDLNVLETEAERRKSGEST